MPVLDVRVLSHGASLVLLPESATIRITAVDADGPRKRIEGSDFVFARTSVIDVRDGRPVREINLIPTDGTYCYQVTVTTTVSGFKLTRHVTIPDVPGPVRLGDRPDVDPKTFQPTADVIAAWEEVAGEAVAARDASVAARTAAETAATAADGSAATASAAKNSAASSALSAATSAGDADASVVAAGQAANSASTSAIAANGSARDAGASASAALQSKNAAATSATNAASSKTAAADSASAAGTSATAAAESATTASQAATTATGAATDATAAKTVAQTSASTANTRATDAASSATAAATSATNADTRATDAAASATAASTAKTAAETAKASAETARTGAETAQTGAQTARTGAETAKAAAELARDVSLAGQFNGSAIAAGTDLNAITSRGVFRQGTGANATLALNYPAAGTGGILEVFSPNASVDYLIQRYTPFGQGNASARGLYLRVRDNGTWAAWRFEATQRINRPAGQPGVEVLPWDDTTSAEMKVMPVNLPLGSVNLDLVLLDGTYYQDNGANATTANSYPTVATNTAGILRVSRRNHDNWIVQEWNPLSFTATQQSITLIRRRINSTWQAWQIVPTSLTDSSVGRRQFLVDEVNGRLNMVYGDTGRRQFVAADMLNGVTGSWTLRRNGYTVTIEGNPAPQTDIPAGSAVAFGVVPAGFRPTMVNMRQPFRTSSSTVMQGIMIAGTTFEISLYAFQNYTVNQGPTPFSLTFQTVDTWPTSLPGAALGVIPVN